MSCSRMSPFLAAGLELSSQASVQAGHSLGRGEVSAARRGRLTCKEGMQNEGMGRSDHHR